MCVHVCMCVCLYMLGSEEAKENSKNRKEADAVGVWGNEGLVTG